MRYRIKKRWPPLPSNTSWKDYEGAANKELKKKFAAEIGEEVYLQVRHAVLHPADRASYVDKISDDAGGYSAVINFFTLTLAEEDRLRAMIKEEYWEAYRVLMSGLTLDQIKARGY